MQTLSYKTIVITIALLSILTISVIPLSNVADAKTYNGTIQTFAFLTAAPNPIGVGQQLFLSMWIDKVPNTATGIGGDRWQNMKITVTKPDGTTETSWTLHCRRSRRRSRIIHTNNDWQLHIPNELSRSNTNRR